MTGRSWTTDAAEAGPGLVRGWRRRTWHIVSPDGTRSARWDGTAAADNTAVFDGPDCAGEPLFRCTLVLATSPAGAARAARSLGLQAEASSLGAAGATGPRADQLYYCAPAEVTAPVGKVVDLTDGNVRLVDPARTAPSGG